jgi:predicted enzyme related to lactoylglutathione lyase
MLARLYVNIDVPDLRRATEFYTRAFELTVARDLSKHGIMELKGTTASVFLLEKQPGTHAAPGATTTRAYARHWTPVHLDFVVDDIDAALERVRKAGASVEQEIADHEWGRIALLADPFGNGFCLVQMTERGYDALL